ncbi:hypothetical protein BDV96DRAFT_580672 [Lophiotrema nucula]|uniref:Uncharacterized protein n=1 Tax=Lophiotrema nucula TaxID=690887 RepID=A0A6A5YZ14_9PLEO|nr:hypothetical protein BDV96DRAFT_580672 [Lophiotrema nucula]
MALPKAPKKSVTGTKLPSTTQQAKSKSSFRKRSIEEVEPDDAHEHPQSLSEAGLESQDAEHESSPASSQEGRSGDRLALLMEKMVEDQRKRHRARNTAIQASYESTSTSVQTSITNLLDEYDGAAAEAHTAQLARLTKLLKSKADLEAAMDAKVSEMKKVFCAHAKDLQIVLEKRMLQLR